MSAVIIESKKFLETMMLPDQQRRKVLERLGARLMKQLKVEKSSTKTAAAVAKL